MMESSPTAIAPLLLRNLLTSLFVYADKPLVFLAEKHKLLEFLRYFLVSAFLFFLRLLPSFFPSLNPIGEFYDHPLKPGKKGDYHYPAAGDGAVNGGGGESGIARALSQVLAIVNDIPVSSRKYEVVRSLAERLIDENLLEGSEALRDVNRKVISAAFSRALAQLEAAVSSQGYCTDGNGDGTAGRIGEADHFNRLSRVLRAARYYGEAVWLRGKSREELSRSGISAEKLAAELLWLAQKMAACGCAEEAVSKWASASNLAWLSLSAEPRLQGSLVKASAFLLTQAKGTEKEENEECTKELQRQTKMKMLVSWLPLLCRASNGTDAPVLSFSERADLGKVLEQIIETLEEEEQEKVLALWLHHFTYCPSSDWPNLHDCYTRWCTASRKLLL